MKRRTFLGGAIAAIAGSLVAGQGEADETAVSVKVPDGECKPAPHWLGADWASTIESSRPSSTSIAIQVGGDKRPIYDIDKNGNWVLVGEIH